MAEQKEKHMKGQPFFFDEHIFDENDLTNLPVEEPPEEAEFTNSQLTAAKEKAFEEGKKAGFKESEESLTKQNLTLLDKISGHISKLFDAEQQRATIHENEAVHLTIKIMQKLFPIYAEKHGSEELTHIIKTALTDQSIPQKLKIELNPSQQVGMDTFLKENKHAINKDIELLENPALSHNECHITWPDGGIICNRDMIVEKIFTSAKDALAERGITVHDKEDDVNNIVKENTEEHAGDDTDVPTEPITQDQ